jgi:hypothetical protein
MNNITTITSAAQEALFNCCQQKSDEDRPEEATPDMSYRDGAPNPPRTCERRITLVELLAQSLLIALRRDAPSLSQTNSGADLALQQSLGANVRLSDVPEWERR